MILSQYMLRKVLTFIFLIICIVLIIIIFSAPLAVLFGDNISYGKALKTVISYPLVVEHELFREGSYFIPYDALPQCAINSIMSVEDKRFKYINGVDIIAIARVAVMSLSNDHTDHGGSTITQQLARRIIQEPRNKVNIFVYTHRFLRILYYTLIVNNVFTKRDIITLYLNSVYYGKGATGIESAAHSYFHTDIHHLTFGQCIYLTGLPQAPSIFGKQPQGKVAMDRYRHVISTMVRNGYISVGDGNILMHNKLFINAQ